MSLLALHVGADDVTALVVTPDGVVVASAQASLSPHARATGHGEPVPEDLWRAVLTATRTCLDRWDGDPDRLQALGIASDPSSVVLWDRETLGSPRPVLGPLDGAATRPSPGPELGARLAWLAGHEPHTWALVEQGRYAIGTVESYLVARLSLGTWHLTDVAHAAGTGLLDLATGDWSEEQCGRHGVPLEALPEVGPSWGRLARTEPRSFLGLDLPVTGIAAEQAAALLGHSCLDAGDAWCDHASGLFLVNTGTELLPGSSGHLPTALWRSPGGETTYGLAGELTTGSPTPTAAFEVRGLVDTLLSALTRLTVDASVDDGLCQLHADLLGVGVRRTGEPQAAALGAALLAGLGIGLWDSPADLRGLARRGDVFTPGDRDAAETAVARWRAT